MKRAHIRGSTLSIGQTSLMTHIEEITAPKSLAAHLLVGTMEASAAAYFAEGTNPGA